MTAFWITLAIGVPLTLLVGAHRDPSPAAVTPADLWAAIYTAGPVLCAAVALTGTAKLAWWTTVGIVLHTLALLAALAVLVGAAALVAHWKIIYLQGSTHTTAQKGPPPCRSLLSSCPSPPSCASPSWSA